MVDTCSLQRWSFWLKIGLGTVILASLGYLFATLWQASVYSFDDAYISFRYAQNLATGNGLVWNPGESPPIEGYTSFFWVILMSLFGATAPLINARLLSLLSLFAMAWLLVRMTTQSLTPDSRNSKTWLATFLVTIFLFAHNGIALLVLSGMETIFAMFCVTLFAFLLDRFMRRPANATIGALGLAALLCGLTRPDLNLITLPSIVTAVLLRRNHWKLFGTFLLTFVVPGLLYFLWRSHRSGFLFPLPFYIKQGGGGSFPGWFEIKMFLWISDPLLLLGIPGLVLGSRRRFRICLLPGVIAFLGYFLFPQHISGVFHRFLLPAYPILVLLAAEGALGLIAWASRARALACLAVILVASLSAYRQVRLRPVQLMAAQEHGQSSCLSRIRLGRTLNNLDDSGTKLLAIGDAGAVPYFSRWKVVDTFGLNDSTLAFRTTRPYDFNYVFSQGSDLAVLLSQTKDSFTPRLPYEQGLLRGFTTRGYRHACSVRFNSSYYLWLLVSPSAQFGEELCARLATPADNGCQEAFMAQGY